MIEIWSKLLILGSLVLPLRRLAMKGSRWFVLLFSMLATLLILRSQRVVVFLKCEM